MLGVLKQKKEIYEMQSRTAQRGSEPLNILNKTSTEHEVSVSRSGLKPRSVSETSSGLSDDRTRSSLGGFAFKIPNSEKYIKKSGLYQ